MRKEVPKSRVTCVTAALDIKRKKKKEKNLGKLSSSQYHDHTAMLSTLKVDTNAGKKKG